MSPYEPLQSDTRHQQFVIADTRTIAFIASKKNFDPDKERRLIEKSRMSTKCRCRHFTGTEPCMYRNCRHFVEMHYKGGGLSIDGS